MNQILGQLQQRWPLPMFVGTCGITDVGSGDCSSGKQGSKPLSRVALVWQINTSQPAQALEHAMLWCIRECLACPRCLFVSVSAQQGDCSWFTHCQLNALLTQFESFITVAVRANSSFPPLSGPVPALSKHSTKEKTGLAKKKTGLAACVAASFGVTSLLRWRRLLYALDGLADTTLVTTDNDIPARLLASRRFSGHLAEAWAAAARKRHRVPPWAARIRGESNRLTVARSGYGLGV
eukprot:CAMPEP_0119384508 /NCGR_PEP_ID=MMETSP1334-20130426/85784_1 /TAXON_ID=127549 /ORGANISM="Calcidiscus leptoporus, Strain RCC1130" /LENGTH=236 /DNA_ID=CAMNT_0007405529 /DNA_START=55 /DNA_END=762 /DNA_ORIENTATION=-